MDRADRLEPIRYRCWASIRRFKRGSTDTVKRDCICANKRFEMGSRSSQKHTSTKLSPILLWKYSSLHSRHLQRASCTCANKSFSVQPIFERIMKFGTFLLIPVLETSRWNGKQYLLTRTTLFGDGRVSWAGYEWKKQHYQSRFRGKVCLCDCDRSEDPFRNVNMRSYVPVAPISSRMLDKLFHSGYEIAFRVRVRHTTTDSTLGFFIWRGQYRTDCRTTGADLGLRTGRVGAVRILTV